MAGTLVKTGKRRMLDSCVAEISTDMKLVLFKASVVISDDTVYGDLTIADYSGYSSQTVSFPASSIDGDAKASSLAPMITFTHSGGGTSNVIYGYALVDVGDNTLIFVEMFAAPQSMSVSGDFIKITPTLKHTQDLT